MAPMESHFAWRPQLRDAIVSFNQRDFGAAPARFGIRVLLPRDASRNLQK